MNAIDTVKSLFSAIEAKDYTRAESLLTDDFAFEGVTPTRVTRREFIDLHRYALKAMPDWKFNAHDYSVSGDKVHCKVKISGTHSEVLDLPMMEIHSIAPTHKHLRMPDEPCTFTLRGDKVYRMEVKRVEGGGVEGILSQLNIKVPHHESSH
jgi:hypothetical protein